MQENRTWIQKFSLSVQYTNFILADVTWFNILHGKILTNVYFYTNVKFLDT